MLFKNNSMLKNILIVENQIEDCQAIESKIKAVYPSANIKSVNDGIHVLSSLESEIPDYIIMDIDMPKLNGLETTRIITNSFPKINVIIISSKKTEGELLQMVNIGAKGFIEKGCSCETFWNAFTSIDNGKFYFSEAILSRYSPRKNQELDNDNVVGILSISEEEEKQVKTPQSYGIKQDQLLIIKYICDNLKNEEIALKICRHVRSLEYKITKLFKITGTHNRHELKDFAIKNGWHKVILFDNIA